MTKARVCLLVGYYPPAAESGARRPYNLVRELCRAGHEVEVIVAGPGNPGSASGDHGEMVVHAAPPIDGNTPPQRRSFLERLRDYLIRLCLYQPDVAHRYRRALERLISGSLNNGRTILYTSVPPGGLAALAVRAARRQSPDQVVIVEFRDPWTTEVHGPRLRPFRGRYERQRQRTLAAANAMVAVTTGIAHTMNADQPMLPAIVAANGVPDELLDRQAEPPRDTDRELSLLYLGEFYLQRDPTPLFGALASIRKDAPAELGQFRLDLLGEVEETPAGPLTKLLAESGLSDFTRTSHRVPYQQARRFLESADIFLLLAQHQPRQVPNKLFEYMAFRRPILAIVDEQGETARLLREAGYADTMVFPESSPAEVERATREAVRQARADISAGDLEMIRSLATSRQLDKVVALIDQLSSGGGGGLKTSTTD